MNAQNAQKYFQALSSDEQEAIVINYLTTVLKMTDEQAMKHYHYNPQTEQEEAEQRDEVNAFYEWYADQKKVQWLGWYIDIWNMNANNDHMTDALSGIYQIWCFTSGIPDFISADDLLHALTSPQAEEEQQPVVDDAELILLEMDDANNNFTGAKECQFTLAEFLHENTARSVTPPTVEQIVAVCTLKVGEIAHSGGQNLIKRIR